jgi:two-component sensor histidine kinase
MMCLLYCVYIFIGWNYLNMKKGFLLLFIMCSMLVLGKTQQDSIAIENHLKEAKELLVELKYDHTYETLLQALKLAKESNENALAFKTEIAIANMYLMKNEPKEAGRFFENKVPDQSFPAYIQSFYYHRKAFYYNTISNHNAALVTAKHGIQIALANNLTGDLRTLYNEIAFTYEHLKNYTLAEEYYNNAMVLAKDDLRARNDIYINKARVYATIKKYKQSNQMLHEIINETRNTNFHLIKIHAYGMFASNYKHLGDSSNYYKYLYLNREEALNAQQEYSEKQYKDLLLKYQSREKDELIAKKELQQQRLVYLMLGLTLIIAITFLLIIFIRRKNIKLNKLLSKNSFLLSELNHRTKNNLQLIVALTARETNKNDSKEMTGLANVAAKIESIASLHKQLYLNVELNTIFLKPYVEEIITTIQPFLQQNEISINTNITDVEIDANDALYIGLIINELLTNSIKHAFATQDNKQINVMVSSKKQLLNIDYRDNGVGISEETRVKLISTLSRQINADYVVENKNGFRYNAYIKLKT